MAIRESSWALMAWAEARERAAGELSARAQWLQQGGREDEAVDLRAAAWTLRVRALRERAQSNGFTPGKLPLSGARRGRSDVSGRLMRLSTGATGRCTVRKRGVSRPQDLGPLTLPGRPRTLAHVCWSLCRRVRASSQSSSS